MNKKQKIMLVEDEESLAVGLQFNLEEEGYEVVHARDGKQALEFYESESYDLIILDVMLKNIPNPPNAFNNFLHPFDNP